MEPDSFKEQFREFIERLKEAIVSYYGERLVSIVLFGSQARAPNDLIPILTY